MNQPLIVSLSPRPGGNSDLAAECFARSLRGPSRLERLRDYSIAPCVACDGCLGRGVCVRPDGADRLFDLMDQASGLVLTAPVYFYHLPAQAKAWIDRGQARYLARQSGLSKSGPIRPAYLVLVAGRPQGDLLFEGMLLSLRYFLEVCDYCIAGQVLLRGVDQAGSFDRMPHSLQAVGDLAGESGW